MAKSKERLSKKYVCESGTITPPIHIDRLEFFGVGDIVHVGQGEDQIIISSSVLQLLIDDLNSVLKDIQG